MLYVVGIGPGNKGEMTLNAIQAIESSEVIVGYKTYIDLIEEHLEGKEVVVNGMRGEVQRCTKAIDMALDGKNVAVISSGDPGVYAMSGLVLQIIAERKLNIQVEIIPGITSANGASASLGAPIMHDHAYISLSDLLTDFDLIKKRLSLAAQGDFVICLFNPKSKGRPTHIHVARDILLEHKSEDTLVGIVKNAKRVGEKVIITTLKDMLEHPIDMTTMVIIGNSNTFKYGDFMITPRGYQL